MARFNITNALTFDIEEWFHAKNMRQCIRQDSWDHCHSRVEKSTLRLLDILDEHHLKATFFVLGWVAEKKPRLILEVAKRGHEIACHGFSHHSLYEMTPASFEKDLKRSLSILRKITEQDVIGFRAPNFSMTEHTHWALDILIRNGILYDSSVFPINRFRPTLFANCSPYVIKETLMEFPASCSRIFGVYFPLGGAYFRIFPYFFSKRVITKQNSRNRAVVFYLHPWDMDPGQPHVQLSAPRKFRQYFGLVGSEKKLRKLLTEFKFAPLRDILQF